MQNVLRIKFSKRTLLLHSKPSLLHSFKDIYGSNNRSKFAAKRSMLSNNDMNINSLSCSSQKNTSMVFHRALIVVIKKNYNDKRLLPCEHSKHVKPTTNSLIKKRKGTGLNKHA